MDVSGDRITLSASDVANHLGCQHLTQFELAAARGKLQRPHWEDPRLEVLQERGRAHERSYIEYLQAQGVTVAFPESTDGNSVHDETRELMAQGVEAIAQAPLAAGCWHGRTDVLLRVEQESDLGNWAYEPVETKLARQTRAETILQLCLYADLLSAYQGVAPERMHVVVPDADWELETFRVAEYIAYYRLVRARLEEDVAAPGDTYPDPVPRCETCRWWSLCDKQWRGDDHLSLVAGISRLHRKELRSHGVDTLSGLGQLSVPIPFKPQRGSAETYRSLREQARVQVEQRAADAPVYELLPVAEGQGIARLPEPSAADVFFDIEGDPFAGSRGLEYLFGWLAQDETGEWTYTGEWAFTPAEEKAIFERFMDAMEARWQYAPDFHIYHFGAYEPATLKRLMGRHATREEALDRMLRAGLFVDLHTVTRQGVRAGVERYSLKDLEPFHKFRRELALRDANLALQAVEVALEADDPTTIDPDIRTAVAGYNEEDCRSTAALRDWLEDRRAELEAAGMVVDRPEPGEPEPSEGLSEERARVAELMDALSGDVPVDPTERSPDEHGRWILAQLLDWERREFKVACWELFRLSDMEPADLFDERQGIAHLEFECAVPGSGKTPTHRYRFPPQEVGFDRGDLCAAGGGKLGSLARIDRVNGTIDIKKRKDTTDEHPQGVFEFSTPNCKILADAVFALGEWVRDHGLDAAGPYRAARDLLLQRAPRGPELNNGSLRLPNESQLEAAQRLVQELDGGVLAVQGPPGTGKTYTGAHVVLALVRAGKKVGITANSHHVIANLLKEVVEQARKSDDIGLSVMQKVNSPDDDPFPEIRQTKRNEDVPAALASGSAQVAAGTAWLWAREDMRESVDVLIIDEAGQVALARALGVALAARNVVLLGDPRQLEQPIQGSHPEGTDVAALDHLIGPHRTITPGRGLFLETTFRLPSGICAYTSEYFYEGRLTLQEGVEQQRLEGLAQLNGEGLWHLPVEHSGNQVSALEEVDAVRGLVDELLKGDVTWVDRYGDRHPLEPGDILIVAPYNSQVAAISHELPELHVGTVDKFQGRQAPVVIYSMATSTPEEAPRGMAFLYSDNRTNVATSRAQCAVVLVCAPALLTPDCRSPEQIRLANAFCGYAERAREFLR